MAEEANIRTLKEKCADFNNTVKETQPLVTSFGEVAKGGAGRLQAAAELLGQAAATLLETEEVKDGAGKVREEIGKGLGAALAKANVIGFATATRNETVRTVPARTDQLGQPADQIVGSFVKSHETAKSFAETLGTIQQALTDEANRLVGSLEEPTNDYQGRAEQIKQDVQAYANPL